MRIWINLVLIVSLKRPRIMWHANCMRPRQSRLGQVHPGCYPFLKKSKDPLYQLALCFGSNPGHTYTCNEEHYIICETNLFILCSKFYDILHETDLFMFSYVFCPSENRFLQAGTADFAGAKALLRETRRITAEFLEPFRQPPQFFQDFPGG